MGVGNSTNKPDQSDARMKMGQGTGVRGHKGGRRKSGGSGVTGMRKESMLSEARTTNMKHKGKFRAGEQDARDQAGPMSPSALQVKTRRRGNGSPNRMPSPSGD